MKRWLCKMISALFIVAASNAQAATWPTKPITLIVPYTAGGSADTIARRLAEILHKDLNVPVVVENKPGAGASLGTDYVARAQPDGTTLLLSALSPLTIYPSLVKTPYNPMKDLTPLISVAVAPGAIVATKALAVTSLDELIRYATDHPSSVRYGIPGQGTVADMGMLALRSLTKTQMVSVPYRGNSQALTDGLGGVVELLVINTDVLLPHVASGALKPLVVMAPQRLAEWPNVPTMAEAKLPQLQNYFSNFGVFAPAGLPQTVSEPLLAALNRAIASEPFKKFLTQTSLQPGTAAGAAFAKQVQDEYARNAQIIKSEGIKVE